MKLDFGLPVCALYRRILYHAFKLLLLEWFLHVTLAREKNINQLNA